MDITITLPENITLGDITAAKGAIIEASTGYVDWELLYEQTAHNERAISAPGRLLLAIVHQLDGLGRGTMTSPSTEITA